MARRRLLSLLVVVLSLAVALATAEGALVWLDFFDPPLFVRNEAFGYLMKPSQSSATRGHRFQINSHGLRGREIASARTSGSLRVAFLGDSITYGGGSVADGEIFADRLSALLTERLGRPVETVNISAPGWGIENIARYIKARGTFDSDLIVWVLPAVDFRRPFSQLEYHGFPTESRLLRLQYAFALGQHSIAARWSTNTPARGPANAPTPAVLRQNIATLKSVLSQWRERRTPSIVTFVPGRDGYGADTDFADYAQAIADCAVPSIDTGPQLRHAGAASHFLDDMHLNTAGHAVVADVLAPVLARMLVQR